MEIGKIKTQFWKSLIIWVGSIGIFFWSIASISPQSSFKIIGNMGGWVALASFIIGVISFLAGINALITMSLDINKLRRKSFLTWIGSILVFIAMLSSGSSLWETQNSITNTLFSILLISDIMFGIASFFVLIASFSSSSKVKDVSVSRPSKAKTYAKTTLTSKFVDELDDIIFTPQKKSGIGGIILAVSILVFVAVIFIIPSGSNQSTGVKPLPSTTSTLNQLAIVDPKITGNKIQRFQGTIRNNSMQLATKVVVRVDFSKDKEAKQSFDTRYFKIDYVAGSGAYSFDLPFELNYIGQYWWTSKVENAEFN